MKIRKWALLALVCLLLFGMADLALATREVVQTADLVFVLPEGFTVVSESEDGIWCSNASTNVHAMIEYTTWRMFAQDLLDEDEAEKLDAVEEKFIEVAQEMKDVESLRAKLKEEHSLSDDEITTFERDGQTIAVFDKLETGENVSYRRYCAFSLTDAGRLTISMATADIERDTQIFLTFLDGMHFMQSGGRKVRETYRAPGWSLRLPEGYAITERTEAGDIVCRSEASKDALLIRFDDFASLYAKDGELGDIPDVIAMVCDNPYSFKGFVANQMEIDQKQITVVKAGSRYIALFKQAYLQNGQMDTAMFINNTGIAAVRLHAGDEDFTELKTLLSGLSFLY